MPRVADLLDESKTGFSRISADIYGSPPELTIVPDEAPSHRLLFSTEGTNELAHSICAAVGPERSDGLVGRALANILPRTIQNSPQGPTTIDVREAIHHLVLTFDLPPVQAQETAMELARQLGLERTGEQLRGEIEIPACKKDYFEPTKYFWPARWEKPELEKWDSLLPSEVGQLAFSLELDSRAIQWAADRGLLKSGRSCQQECFGVTDITGRAIHAFRRDGQFFPALPDYNIGARLVHTIKHSQLGWPIGLVEAQHVSRIVVVQGLKDFLTMHALLLNEDLWQNIAPVLIMAAPKRFRHDATRLFTQKDVRIIARNDADGATGADRWRKQLSSNHVSFGPGTNPIVHLSQAADPVHDWRNTPWPLLRQVFISMGFLR